MHIFLRILLNNYQSLRVVENDKVQTFTKGFTTHFCEGQGHRVRSIEYSCHPRAPLWEARPLSCVEIFSSSCRVFVLIAGHPTKIQSDLFARWTLSGHFYCLNFWSFGNVILDWVRKIFEYLNLCGLEISLCAGKAEKLTCSFGGL